MNIHFYKPTDLTDTALDRLEFENLTRRRFITAAGGLIGAAALGACGAPGEQAAVPTSAPTATVAATTKTVESAKGPVNIPVNPQRVVALADLVNGYMLASLGYDKLVAVGAGSDANSTSRMEAFGPVPATVPKADIGMWTEPNLEAIAALKPDLILGTDFNHEAIYDQLTQIAPTLLVASDISFDDKQPFTGQRFLAQVLGIEAALDKRLNEYKARLEEVKARIGTKLQGVKYTWIDVYGDTDVYVIRNAVAPGSLVLTDLGAFRSPTTDQQTFGEETVPQISIEQIPSVDADVIFVGYGVEQDANAGNISALGGILAATTAGNADQVFRIRYEAWGFPVVEGLFVALSDLETLFADKEITRSGTFD
jgi:iron complex transport system substrate-binding protein